jgi:pimeloyl-ACP methyl ester carboxylesterase
VIPKYADLGSTMATVTSKDGTEIAYTAKRSPERWKNATLPVLVLDGEASYAFMAAAADAVAEALPHASRQTLADQDHAPAPEAMAPVLREFLGLAR